MTTPVFTIDADNKDITTAIRQRLLSLRITDVAGYDSDTLEITIDDREGIVSLPPTGALLRVSLGYENNLQLMGRFVVDELRLSGPSMKLTITARAADFKQQLKQQKTRAWENITIDGIVSTIAASHELEPIISSPLSDTLIFRIDQTDESDLHFLTRLGKDHDAIAKPTNKKLIFAPRGEAKTASGQPMAPVSLTRIQLSSWSARLSDRNKYQSVTAYYHDTSEGQRIPVTAGQGEPRYTLRNNQPDIATAQQAAFAKFKSLNRGSGSLSFTMPGNPDLMAETPITILGIRTGIDGRWIATRVIHELSSSGYITTVEAETAE